MYTKKITSANWQTSYNLTCDLTFGKSGYIKNFEALIEPIFECDIKRTTEVTVNLETLEIPWIAGQNYTFEITSGFVTQDPEVESFSSLPFSTTFTTRPAPYITSTIPAINSTGILNSTTFTINFDRELKRLSGYIRLYAEGGILLKSFDINSNTDVISFTGTSIQLNVSGYITETSTRYYYLIDANSFFDNDKFFLPAVSNQYDLTYTTTPAPYITGTIPAINSSGPTVLNNTDFTLIYDRNVVKNTGYIYFYENPDSPLLIKTFNVSSTDVTVSGNNVKLNVKGYLKSGTTYFVQLDANVFKDNYGFRTNAVSDNSIRYTTAPAPYFRELIAMEMSTGTIVINPIKRVQGRATINAVSSISKSTVYRIKKLQANISAAATVIPNPSRIRKLPIVMSSISSFNILAGKSVVTSASMSDNQSVIYNTTSDNLELAIPTRNTLGLNDKLFYQSYTDINASGSGSSWTLYQLMGENFEGAYGRPYFSGTSQGYPIGSGWQIGSCNCSTKKRGNAYMRLSKNGTDTSNYDVANVVVNNFLDGNGVEVYKKVGSTWGWTHTLRSDLYSTLSANSSAYANFGHCFDITPDGTTAIVAETDYRGTVDGTTNSGQKVVSLYIFNVSSSTSSLIQKISLPFSSSNQTGSVNSIGYVIIKDCAISNDGNTISMVIDNDIYFYIKSGSTYVLQQKITDAVYGYYGGYSMSMAGVTGDYVAVLIDTGGYSAVKVFYRSAGVWTTQYTQRLDGIARGYQFDNGLRISISDSGESLVASQRLTLPSGTAITLLSRFTRIGTTWTKQQNIFAENYENLIYSSNVSYRLTDYSTFAFVSYQPGTNYFQTTKWNGGLSPTLFIIKYTAL